MYIIGITGGTCSGKTTLTNRLNENLTEKGYKIKTLHMDQFFKNPAPRTTAPYTGIEYVDHNHPNSFKLQEFYDNIDENISADYDIVIIEGLMILHLDYIREKLDLKIFVDLRSDERLVRRVKRFQQNTNQTFEEITDRYLDTVRYRHDEFIEPTRWYADMVINGVLDSHKGTEILLTYIQDKVKLI